MNEKTLLKGDCNKCIHRAADPADKVCAECGIARKNYEEETKAVRVLTAADLKTADTLAQTAVKERLDRLHLTTDTIAIAAYAGAMLGIDEYIKILVGMLTETEASEADTVH